MERFHAAVTVLVEADKIPPLALTVGGNTTAVTVDPRFVKAEEMPAKLVAMPVVIRGVRRQAIECRLSQSKRNAGVHAIETKVGSVEISTV